MNKCIAITKKGTTCRFRAKVGKYCGIHCKKYAPVVITLRNFPLEENRKMNVVKFKIPVRVTLKLPNLTRVIPSAINLIKNVKIVLSFIFPRVLGGSTLAEIAFFFKMARQKS